ncbi:hypothetical protein [Actinoplanes subglobosus]|uniref:Exo-alpha-sialidase n=1 Tax=Actinoplanes subglobosus TaxID=1547892 RepID=A0ABV8J0Q8_9ACTN
MREPQFEQLRSEVGNAVRQPEFSTVQRRAGKVRRRRAASTGAVFLVTALAAVSFGYTVQNTPSDYGSLDPVPTATGDPGTGWPRMIAAASTGTELYGLYRSCPDCDAELYVSTDGGGSWQRRTTPAAPTDTTSRSDATLVALAPGILSWSEQGNSAIDPFQSPGAGGPTAGPTTPAAVMRTWITRNGGETWVRTVAASEPAASVPDGARPADCDLLELPACKVGVIDPDTGRFAPLATQPTGIVLEPGWTNEVNAPLDGRIWVSGLDPATRKPAVATSSDAGRTWHTHVFTDGVAATPEGEWLAPMYLPKVAAGTGTTAYALTYRRDGVFDTHRTTDGGVTWQAGAEISAVQLTPGFVAADGTHIVQTASEPVTGDGPGRYTPAELTGYPDFPMWPVRVASTRADISYVVPAETGAYVSKDGRTWRQARLP